MGCFRHLARERSLSVTIAHRKKKNIGFGSFYSCEPPEFINTQMSLWKIILLRAMKYKYKDTTLTSKNHLWSLLERPQKKWDGKQKIKVAGNDWVGKIHPTLRVTCKRGESGLTFVYKDGPKMCIFVLASHLYVTSVPSPHTLQWHVWHNANRDKGESVMSAGMKNQDMSIITSN